MEIPQELVTTVADRLGPLEGAVMVIGSGHLSTLFGERQPALSVISVDPWSRKAPPLARTIAADPEALPIAPRSLSAIVAVEALSRYPSPDAIVSSWQQALRSSGWIVLVERLIQSATMRALRRLLSAPRYQSPPEQLTSLLLNAGFVSVGQLWPPSRTRIVVTTGKRASFV